MIAANPSAAKMMLSTEQSNAIHTALNLTQGAFFLTGKAGTGKSVVSRAIRNERPTVMLAPTGLAAINVHGQTIHSFFGINPNQLLSKQLGKRDDRLKRVLQTENLLLCFDEISMVRADMFDAIDKIMRATLDQPKRPFGGIPVMCVGDLWQLEPVTTSEDRELLKNYDSEFFFDSSAYKASCAESRELTHVYRQSGEDPLNAGFIKALNLIREGDVTMLDLINDRVRSQPTNVIVLCHSNAKADSINQSEVARLDGESITYTATTEGFSPNEYPVPERITLKVGAKVLVAVNGIDPNGYRHVNGDFGTVVHIAPRFIEVEIDRTGETVTLSENLWQKTRYKKTDQGELIEDCAHGFRQIPVKIGYAITIHKSQGQTLSRAHLTLDRSDLPHGLVYVALSRVKSIRGLTLHRPIFPSDIHVNPRVRAWTDSQKVSALMEVA